MPLYEYQCKKCKHRFEKIHQSYSEPRVKRCPECGGPVEQLLSAPAAHFKGTGWYATDYGRKAEGGKSSDGGSAESGSSESGSGESVPDDSSASKAKENTETKPAEKGSSKESSKESKPKTESKKRK